jgi:hypothetical protein
VDVEVKAGLDRKPGSLPPVDSEANLAASAWQAQRAEAPSSVPSGNGDGLALEIDWEDLSRLACPDEFSGLGGGFGTSDPYGEAVSFRQPNSRRAVPCPRSGAADNERTREVKIRPA